MKQKYRLLFAVTFEHDGTGAVHQAGSTVELTDEQAKDYKHALQRVETEEESK